MSDPHPPYPSPAPSTRRTAVELQAITRSFGTVEALKGIDLELPEATTVALLGPNGAGKSTAISIMLGLLTPDGGTARTLGTSPREAVAAGRVGAMLQTASLPLGARVSELIRFARDLYPRPMAMAAVVDHAGLAPILARAVDGLSGGEAQRVRFGIAIAGDPDLVFLDEPTVGMDVESRRAFWETMRGFAGLGRTILFATHYLDEADQAADRIVVVANGRIVGDGTPAELKSSVGGRVIRFRLPDPDHAALGRLAGVTRLDIDRDRVAIHSDEPDTTLRALLDAEPRAAEIEVQGVRLEDAFLALTGGSAPVHGAMAVAA
jgi:ABC-2 type transport system ATP-binding protein